MVIRHLTLDRSPLITPVVTITLLSTYGSQASLNFGQCLCQWTVRFRQVIFCRNQLSWDRNLCLTWVAQACYAGFRSTCTSLGFFQCLLDIVDPKPILSESLWKYASGIPLKPGYTASPLPCFCLLTIDFRAIYNVWSLGHCTTHHWKVAHIPSHGFSLSWEYDYMSIGTSIRLLPLLPRRDAF